MKRKRKIVSLNELDWIVTISLKFFSILFHFYLCLKRDMEKAQRICSLYIPITFPPWSLMTHLILLQVISFQKIYITFYPANFIFFSNWIYLGIQFLEECLLPLLIATTFAEHHRGGAGQFILRVWHVSTSTILDKHVFKMGWDGNGERKFFQQENQSV